MPGQLSWTLLHILMECVMRLVDSSHSNLWNVWKDQFRNAQCLLYNCFSKQVALSFVMTSYQHCSSKYFEHVPQRVVKQKLQNWHIFTNPQSTRCADCYRAYKNKHAPDITFPIGSHICLRFLAWQEFFSLQKKVHLHSNVALNLSRFTGLKYVVGSLPRPPVAFA